MLMMFFPLGSLLRVGVVPNGVLTPLTLLWPPLYNKGKICLASLQVVFSVHCNMCICCLAMSMGGGELRILLLYHLPCSH